MTDHRPVNWPAIPFIVLVLGLFTTVGALAGSWLVGLTAGLAFVVVLQVV